MRTIQNRTNFVGVMLMLVAVGLIGYQSLGTRPAAPSKPAIVAMVDVERVINQLDAFAEAEARLRELETQLLAEQDSLRGQIEQLLTDSEAFPPGSQRAEEAQREMLKLGFELKALQEHSAGQMEREMSRTLEDIFDEILDAAQELAVRNGYDVVLADDQAAVIVPGTSGEITRQISVRRVLYSNPVLDITNDVIIHLNQ